MRDTIFLLTAILSVVGSLALEYARLPWWYKYLSGAFIATSLVVLVVEFVGPWLATAVSNRRRSRRQNRVANELYGEFQNLIRAFRELVNTRSDENLARYLENLHGQGDWKAKLPPAPPLQYLQDFFGMFVSRADRWNGTYEELKGLAADFHTFLYQYDRLYVTDSLAALRALKRDELPDTYRRKINLLRENYVTFLREYMAFAKAANARVGESPFADWAQLPEEI